MKRGPKPTPKHVKRMRGSWRGYQPDNKPIIKVEKPKRRPRPPKWLQGEALKEWKRVAPKLFKLGLLTSLDDSMLALYCSAYSDYLYYLGFVEKLKNDKKTKESVLAKWTRILQRSWSDVCRLAELFYMSPGHESRILVRPAEKEKTSGEKWLEKRN